MTRVGNKLTAEDGTLAGAAITMRDAVEYLVHVLKVPLVDALMMATLTPARLLRVDNRIGRLKPGLRADLVHLTDDLQLAEVWMGGRRLNESTQPRERPEQSASSFSPFPPGGGRGAYDAVAATGASVRPRWERHWSSADAVRTQPTLHLALQAFSE